MVTFLLVVLLVLTPITSALCPEINLHACRCHVYGKRHMADCSKQGLEAPPRKGSDTYDYLVLSENRLKELPDDSLAVFPNVQILNLSNNFIVELGPGSFRGLQWLESLDLTNNLLRLHHSLDSQFIATHGVKWLSLANNKHIGKDLQRTKLEEDANMTAWLDIPSLRNLSLSNCELSRLPMWMFVGMPGLESLDVSNNRLLVLPVLTLVSTCRLKTVTLAGNPWNCDKCENFRSTNLMDNRIIELNGNNHCAASKLNYVEDCDVNLTQQEEMVKSVCFSKILPEPLVYQEPRSIMFYIGVVAGCLVALVIVSFIVNAACSAICKKIRTKKTTKPVPSVTDQELLQVLPRN